MNKKIALCLASILFLMQGAAAHAATINVAAGSSIQPAVDLAVSGDTINIAAGTFNENIVIDGKSLELIGAGQDATIIDGQQNGKVFYIKPGAGATISNMTIRNGKSDEGAGIANFGTLSLANSKVAGNTADTNGGGILNDGIVTIANCTIAGNTALNGWGGGIGNFGMGIPRVNANLTMTETSVTDNKALSANGATNGYGYGGGIATDGIATILDSVFSNNTSTSWAGGIYTDRNTNLTRVTVSGNSAANGGGILNDDVVTLTDCIISGNKATLQNGGGIGNWGDTIDGVYRLATLTASGTTISNNTAAIYGGGIDGDGNATINGGNITGNTAQRGGGAYSQGRGSITMNGTTVSGNTGSLYGGGIYSDALVTLTDSTVSNNTSPSGGGIFDYKSLFINGTTQIVNNIATTSVGGGIWVYDNTATVTIDGTNVAIKNNQSKQPASESSWYKGWGVYFSSGTPIVTGGFDPITQVTGNSLFCAPSACATLGFTCGTASNGCGGTLNCGGCATGFNCNANHCVANCANECNSSGAKRCNGNGYQTCGNYDSDTCLEWSSVTNCKSNQKCSGGSCVKK